MPDDDCSSFTFFCNSTNKVIWFCTCLDGFLEVIIFIRSGASYVCSCAVKPSLSLTVTSISFCSNNLETEA